MPIDTGKQLAEQLESHRRVGSSARFPMELRARVVAFARTENAKGRRWKEVIEELGLGKTTLTTWLAADRKRSAFLPVVVTAPDKPTAPSSPLSLVSPEGYSLEGLTLDQAVEALRRLQ